MRVKRFTFGDVVQVHPNVYDANGRDDVSGRICTVLATGNTNTDHETLALIDRAKVLVVVATTQVSFIRHAEVK